VGRGYSLNKLFSENGRYAISNVEMLDLENTGITVGILLPWALELEI